MIMAERRSRREKQSSVTRVDKDIVSKTVVQSVTALVIFLVVWGMSVCNYPKITEVCGKIRHYLTYTYDVQSVFNNLYNVPKVNDDTH